MAGFIEIYQCRLILIYKYTQKKPYSLNFVKSSITSFRNITFVIFIIQCTRLLRELFFVC